MLLLVLQCFLLGFKFYNPQSGDPIHGFDSWIDSIFKGWLITFSPLFVIITHRLAHGNKEKKHLVIFSLFSAICFFMTTVHLANALENNQSIAAAFVWAFLGICSTAVEREPWKNGGQLIEPGVSLACIILFGICFPAYAIQTACIPWAIYELTRIFTKWDKKHIDYPSVWLVFGVTLSNMIAYFRIDIGFFVCTAVLFIYRVLERELASNPSRTQQHLEVLSGRANLNKLHY